MKLIQTIIDKTFFVKHRGKEYYVNYLNSDGQCLSMLNRYDWEVKDEEGEEVLGCTFQSMSEKQKAQAEKESDFVDRLIAFCIKHFDDYEPNLE